MYHPTQSIVRFPALAATCVLAAALAAGLGCTHSDATTAENRSASLQSSQPTPSQTVTAAPKAPSAFDTTLEKAKAGDATAMYRVGKMYSTGEGVEKDHVEAFNWYKRAAKAGNSDAMYALGEAYEHGVGVRENIQQAVNWYDQATLKGNKAAKAALDRLGEDFDR